MKDLLEVSSAKGEVPGICLAVCTRKKVRSKSVLQSEAVDGRDIRVILCEWSRGKGRWSRGLPRCLLPTETSRL